MCVHLIVCMHMYTCVCVCAYVLCYEIGKVGNHCHFVASITIYELSYVLCSFLSVRRTVRTQLRVHPRQHADFDRTRLLNSECERCNVLSSGTCNFVSMSRNLCSQDSSFSYPLSFKPTFRRQRRNSQLYIMCVYFVTRNN